MSNSSPHPRLAPIDIGFLRKAKRWLRATCTACGHVACLDTAQTSWPDALLVSEAAKLMRCSKCGARPTETRPDNSVRIDGQYPRF